MKITVITLIGCLSICILSCGASNGTSISRTSPQTPAEMAWERAHSLEEDGDMAAAASAFRVLCVGAEQYVRACYDRCRVMFELPDVNHALSCAEAFVVANPDHGLAPAMARNIGRTYELDSRFATGAQAIDRLAVTVQGTDVWDSLIYEKARLMRKAENLSGEQAALMRIVAQGRWGSQLWDNAIWRVILIARKNGDERQEEMLLLQMLDAKEDSKLIASYNSPHYDDALFRLGEMYANRNELKRAYEAFERLSDWETSRLRDNAILQCAYLKKSEGDLEGACSHLRVLLDNFPESGSARDAKSLAEDWHCSQKK